MLDDYSDILTCEEVREILYTGKNTLYTLLSTGKLRGFRVGKKWRITKLALYEYIKGNSLCLDVDE